MRACTIKQKSHPKLTEHTASTERSSHVGSVVGRHLRSQRMLLTRTKCHLRPLQPHQCSNTNASQVYTTTFEGSERQTAPTACCVVPPHRLSGVPDASRGSTVRGDVVVLALAIPSGLNIAPPRLRWGRIIPIPAKSVPWDALADTAAPGSRDGPTTIQEASP